MCLPGHSKDILKVGLGIEFRAPEYARDDRIINFETAYLKEYDSNFTYGYSGGMVRLEDYTQANGRDRTGFEAVYACARAGVSVKPIDSFYLDMLSGPCYFTSANTLLSGNIQFNTELGYGFIDPKTGSTVGITIRHFSNAGLKDPNIGINTMSLTMGVNFD